MTKSTLRLGYAGTPELAARVLSALLTKSRYKIEIVFTQPDRPAGRGRKIALSPVKQLALEHHINIQQPDTPDSMDPQQKLKQMDALIVVAYGMILPEIILNRPKHGCLNIHTSLLPKWRGAAPIQRAIQAGDAETGVTIIQMDTGLDTGPVLGQKKCPVAANETSGSLHDKLADLGAICLLEVLDAMASDNINPVPQNPAMATYARKITKSEAQLDWSRPAIELERTIRAFNPAPVAHANFDGISLRVWDAAVISQTTTLAPGTIVNYSENGIDVATGVETLRLLKIQPAGRRVMTAREFYNGHPDFFCPQNPA